MQMQVKSIRYLVVLINKKVALILKVITTITFRMLVDIDYIFITVMANPLGLFSNFSCLFRYQKQMIELSEYIQDIQIVADLSNASPVHPQEVATFRPQISSVQAWHPNVQE